MINITIKAARAHYQIEMDRQIQIFETKATKQFRPILSRQFSNAAKLAQQGVTIIPAVDDEKGKLISILSKHYRQVATVFSDKVFKIIKVEKNFSVPETKGPKDEFWKVLNKWMLTQAGNKITKVQKTTKRSIANIIKVGMDEGESNAEIAKRIRDAGLISSPYRAKVIARTETHTAANMSVDAAVKSTHVEMESEWVATLDERVRISHAKADGQKIKQGETFKVGGQDLKYPGDSNGSAENVINCRCVLIYHTVKKS